MEVQCGLSDLMFERRFDVFSARQATARYKSKHSAGRLQNDHREKALFYITVKRVWGLNRASACLRRASLRLGGNALSPTILGAWAET
jgi:hypothetical protein